MVFSLIASAGAFGYLLALLKVPTLITNGLLAISHQPVVLLLLINIMLLLLGCIMDMAPLILIVTPILTPIVSGVLGMSLVQFGVVLIFNLAVGLCTPPVGSALFVGCGVGGISVEKAVKAMMPYYLVMVIGLLLVTFIPSISLALPRALGFAC